MDRRAFLGGSLAVGILSVMGAARGQSPGRFADPPASMDADDKALFARAVAALESGQADLSGVLSDPAYMRLHPHEEFRKFIAAHAAPALLALCSASEPGLRMRLVCAFVDAKGDPIRDALIYLYHTSAKGWYSENAGRFSGNSGDERHARLFGYVRTDTDGKIKVHTIRPAGYPDSDLPSHVHVEAFIGNEGVLVSEVQFDDDPRLTPAQRGQSARAGFTIAEPQAQPDGSVLCEAQFKVNAPRTR